MTTPALSPPPATDPEHREWLTRGVISAHEGIARIETSIGQSPDLARGTPGNGLLGQLARLISQQEARAVEDATVLRVKEARTATLRAALAGAGGTVALIGGLITIAKALGWLH
jgi:hypothetical protein